MADAMDDYEKEAGCVPILHPEVTKSTVNDMLVHAIRECPNAYFC